MAKNEKIPKMKYKPRFLKLDITLYNIRGVDFYADLYTKQKQEHGTHRVDFLGTEIIRELFLDKQKEN